MISPHLLAGLDISGKYGKLRLLKANSRPQTGGIFMQRSSKDLDQFYTKPEVAKIVVSYLFSILKKIPGYSKKSIQYIEPSAGSGYILNCLPNKKVKTPSREIIDTRKSFDLDPKHAEVVQADFLSTAVPEIGLLPYVRRVIIGNPPFGKRSDLAIKFFNKSADWAPVIAFIIPVQFKKWGVQKKLHPKYKLVGEIDLPKDAFLLDGKPYDVRCCFQVWTSKPTKLTNFRRTASPKIKCGDFKVWQYNNTPSALKVFENKFDFAVLRQGYGDYKDFKYKATDYSKSKQWILFKAPNKRVLKILKALDFALLSEKNTTTPGFGKADVIEAYEKEILK